MSQAEPAPLCSVIVCSLNGERVLPACLRSLRSCGAGRTPYEVIVVDNGSTDATPALVRRDFPEARLVQTGRNLGFAGGNNAGMLTARGEILVLLNDDTEVPADWIDALCAPFARDPAIGAVGCKLLYPDRRTIQHAGGLLYPNGNTGHHGMGEVDNGQWDTPGERAYVTGAALALRRAALAQVGLLDPGYFPIYFEEVDLQTRLARAGWKIHYEPAAWLVHHESQSQGAGSPRFVYRYTKNRIRYLAHFGFVEGLGPAVRAEAAWLRSMARARRLVPVLRAYVYGAVHWPAWRLDRQARRGVPRLP
ncbi:MAG TPA: glycosyltransferase family 2 protein [Candidatus Sumerlaeota bacterium]|nr:glycosyltransferase family 2 protein [Candidatus Sumerlaeota bacterium]